MAKNFFRVANGLKFPGLTSAPADLADGDIYFNTTLGKFRQKTGGSEADLGGSAAGGAFPVRYLDPISRFLPSQLQETGLTFSALYDFTANADYGAGSLTASLLNGAAINGGILNLVGTGKAIQYISTSNFTSTTACTVRMKVVPQYSGTPGDYQIFFAITANTGSPGNSPFFQFMHQPASGSFPGQLYLGLTGFYNGGIGAWSPTAGRTYEFEINIDGSNLRVFIDGALFYTSTGASITPSSYQLITLGQQSGASITNWAANFLVREFDLFNTVQHTSAYPAVSQRPQLPYKPDGTLLADTDTVLFTDLENNAVQYYGCEFVFLSQPAPGDQVNFDSPFGEGDLFLTFVTGSPGANDVQIGSTLAQTMQNFATRVQAYTTKYLASVISSDRVRVKADSYYAGATGDQVSVYVDSVAITPDRLDPNGTFKLHPVITADDRVWKATVSGNSVAWTLVISGQSQLGTPTDGDGIYIKEGGAASDTLWYYSGSSWYNYGAKIEDSAQLEGRLVSKLGLSVYQAVTPNLFASEGASRVSSSNGNLINDYYLLEAGRSLVSTQNLDADYLSQGLLIQSAAVQLFYDLGGIDNNPTVELSRNGGAVWQSVPVSRISGDDSWYGSVDFSRELVTGFGQNITGTGLQFTVFTPNWQRIAGKFNSPVSGSIFNVDVRWDKIGSPAGNATVQIIKDSGGSPSASSADIVASYSTPASSIPGTATVQTLVMSGTVVAGQDYWIVYSGDSAYIAGSTGGTNAYNLYGASDAGLGVKRYDGSWQVFDANDALYGVVRVLTDSMSVIDTYPVINADTFYEFNTTTQQGHAQSFILSSAQTIKSVTSYPNKVGSPSGTFTVSIVKDVAGSPSTLASDRYWQSASQSIPNVVSGNPYIIDLSQFITLPAGTYWIVYETDAAYKSSFSTGVTAFRSRIDSSSPTAPGVMKIFNGTTWSTNTGSDMCYIVQGSPLDLRLRVTSSMASTKLRGYGVFYDKGVSDKGGVYSNEVVTMDTTANPQKVTVGFLSDPDLVEVNDLETGQTFLYPAFTIDGYDIKFTTNPFPVSPATRQFRVRQSKGASVDNNEKNAALLAANRLGSTNPSLDRSVAGEGILLRASNGTLVEASIQWNGSNYVWQFAEVT